MTTTSERAAIVIKSIASKDSENVFKIEPYQGTHCDLVSSIMATLPEDLGEDQDLPPDTIQIYFFQYMDFRQARILEAHLKTKYAINRVSKKSPWFNVSLETLVEEIGNFTNSYDGILVGPNITKIERKAMILASRLLDTDLVPVNEFDSYLLCAYDMHFNPRRPQDMIVYYPDINSDTCKYFHNRRWIDHPIDVYIGCYIITMSECFEKDLRNPRKSQFKMGMGKKPDPRARERLLAAARKASRAEGADHNRIVALFKAWTFLHSDIVKRVKGL